MRARRLLGAAALATLGAALWWRKNPSACPYGQRFWVEAPHPIITRDRLRSVLRPEPGERILEIGPGTGYYTLDMAEWVGPEGTVEIFDLQQEFLDHAMRPRRRARPRQRRPDPGRRHRAPLRGRLDGRRRPHRRPRRDPRPGRRAARDRRGSSSPSGRLIVGELFGDPHFTTQAALQTPGLRGRPGLGEHSGNWFGYFARLSRSDQ